MNGIKHIELPIFTPTKMIWMLALFAIAGGGVTSVLVSMIGPLKTVVALMALFVTLGTVLYLEFGLALLIFLSYINFENVAIEFYGIPSVVKFFVFVPLGTVALHWILDREEPQGWEEATILSSLYGAVILASLIGSDTLHEQYGRLLMIYAKYAITAILMTLLIQRKRTLHRVIWVLIAAGAFLGTMTSIQSLTQTFQNNYLGFAQVEVQHIVGRTNDYRSGGPLGEPNAFAQILFLPLALAIDRAWNESHRMLRLAAGFTLIVCILSMIFTFSRGALWAFLVMLAVMMYYRPPRLRTIFITLCLVVILAPVVPASYLDRMRAMLNAVPIFGGNVKNEISVQGRTSEMIVSWQMFRDHPFLGVGWKNHGKYYQQYSRELGLDSRRAERVAHNLFQEVAAETGVVGFMMFGAILWIMFRGLHQARQDFMAAELPDEADLTLAVSLGLIGYLTAACFLQNSYPRYFWLPLGITLAIPHIARFELNAKVSKGSF